jgi:outer membrane immunogenic protein
MKKLLLSTVALIGLSAGALAADLPSRRAAPAPYVAVPVFTWTGFYVGVNAGYGFSDNTDDVLFVPPGTFGVGGFTGTVTSGNSNSRDGFVGGGQIGYNYQFGQFVVGLEADIQAADLSSSRNNGLAVLAGTGLAPVGFVYANQFDRGIDWFGTVRGRAGVAFDRLLVFGTGGLAYGGGGNSNTCFGLVNCSNNDDIRTGYTFGGGVEYAFTPNWTVKLEGLYVNLDGNKNANSTLVGVTAAGSPVYSPVGTTVGQGRRDDEFGVVRVGLNYKF